MPLGGKLVDFFSGGASGDVFSNEGVDYMISIIHQGYLPA